MDSTANPNRPLMNSGLQNLRSRAEVKAAGGFFPIEVSTGAVIQHNLLLSAYPNFIPAIWPHAKECKKNFNQTQAPR